MGLSLDLSLLEEAQRCDSCEYFPFELRRHTVDEVIVFRIPLNFALPSRNKTISHASHTEHRVGEDVGFGVGDMMSLAAQ